MATIQDFNNLFDSQAKNKIDTHMSGYYDPTPITNNPLFYSLSQAQAEYAQTRKRLENNAAAQKAQNQIDPFSLQNMSATLGQYGLGGAAGEAGMAGYSSAYTPDANPWLTRLNALLDNPDSINESAAYKFRFDQGQKALERSAAARGSLNSGNTLAALSTYGQGQAAQEYGDQFKRLSDLYGYESDAGAKRYGSDVAAQASNRNAGLDSYVKLFELTGAPGSTKRGQGLQTSSYQTIRPALGW